MDPVAIRLGPLQVHWYGILIVGGAVLGAWLAGREAKRRGYNPDHIWNMLAVVLFLGIIGARLYHVFSQPVGGFTGWDYYRQNPGDIFAFWKGEGGFRGLGIYGGIVGGFLGILLYTKFAKLNFLEWVDFAVPALLVGQIVGRWGNFINQELYGPPTDLPWGISIDCAHRFGPYLCPPNGTMAADTRFHPTFLYESLWNLAGLLLVLFLLNRFRSRLRTGDLLFFYMIFYPLGRFWLEIFFRPDAWSLGSLPAASVFSLIAIVVGIAGLIYNHRFRKLPTPTPVAVRGKRSRS